MAGERRGPEEGADAIVAGESLELVARLEGADEALDARSVERRDISAAEDRRRSVS